MSHSQSPLSHRDVLRILDRALSNGRGVRVACESLGKAKNLRQRCYTMRAVDRKENTRIYQPADAMYGLSVYDCLTLDVGEDAGVIYLIVEVSAPERLESLMQDLAPYPAIASSPPTPLLTYQPPTRDQINTAMSECNDPHLTDEEYWQAVHKKLGLTYGDLFPILNQEPTPQ